MGRYHISECFWLCHSIGVLSHVIVVSWLSNWSLSTLLTCERSFVISSNLVYCKVDSLFKTFATLVAEEVDHDFSNICTQLIKIGWNFKFPAHFKHQFYIMRSQWYSFFLWPSSRLFQKVKTADPLRFNIIRVSLLTQGLQARELEVTPWVKSEPLRIIIVPKNTSQKKLLLKFARPGSGWTVCAV